MPKANSEQNERIGSRETKNDKFKRLARNRVGRATRALQGIGKLANNYNYDYSDAEAQKIISHLTKELEDLKRKFTMKPRKPGNEFNFD
jgi:hypothetical protein